MKLQCHTCGRLGHKSKMHSGHDVGQEVKATVNLLRPTHTVARSPNKTAGVFIEVPTSNSVGVLSEESVMSVTLLPQLGGGSVRNNLSYRR